MTRLYKDLGSAFDSLRSQSDGGRGGGGERKEGGRKEGEWIGERRKGTPASSNPALFTSADAGVPKFLKQACSANQTGDFS